MPLDSIRRLLTSTKVQVATIATLTAGLVLFNVSAEQQAKAVQK